MQLTRSTFSFLLFFSLAIIQSTSQSTTTTTITNAAKVSKPGCQSQCGNVTIPYPFGIGPGCFLSDWFEMTCNTTFTPPKPFIGVLPILEISISDSTFRVSNKVASKCYDQLGNITKEDLVTTNLGWTSPFTLSQQNQFILIGCDNELAVMQRSLRANFTTGGNASSSRPEEVVNGSCSGVRCCQNLLIPKGTKNYSISLSSMVSNHTNIWSFDLCTYSFMGEQERFTFGRTSDLMDPDFKNTTKSSVPMLVDWVIGNLSCSEARDAGVLACKENSYCIDSDTGVTGYRCSCYQGYQGQPYLDPGCQYNMNDEYDDPSRNLCEKNCRNTLTGYFAVLLRWVSTSPVALLSFCLFLME